MRKKRIYGESGYRDKVDIIIFSSKAYSFAEWFVIFGL